MNIRGLVKILELCFQRKREKTTKTYVEIEWTFRESNPRPHACEACALPLCQMPSAIADVLSLVCLWGLPFGVVTPVSRVIADT